jgi:hypothetical protein
MFLTMYRTARSAYSRTATDMFHVLFREGLLYYRCVGARILHHCHSAPPNTVQLHMQRHFGFDYNDQYYGPIYPQRRFSVRMLLSPYPSPQPI